RAESCAAACASPRPLSGSSRGIEEQARFGVWPFFIFGVCSPRHARPVCRPKSICRVGVRGGHRHRVLLTRTTHTQSQERRYRSAVGVPEMSFWGNRSKDLTCSRAARSAPHLLGFLV